MVQSSPESGDVFTCSSACSEKTLIPLSVVKNEQKHHIEVVIVSSNPVPGSGTTLMQVKKDASYKIQQKTVNSGETERQKQNQIKTRMDERWLQFHKITHVEVDQ